MFNRTVINSTNTEYVPYEKNVSVHEHKAATDKSIELLNNMQKEARKNIVDTICISNNDFNATFVVFNRPDCYSQIIRYKYEVNHKEYEGEIIVNPVKTKDKVIEQICDEIKQSLLELTFNALSKELIKLRIEK